jgi:hypothetical protein
MQRQFIFAGALIAAAAGIAACNDATGIAPCSVTTLPAPQLLYPKPGAVGVPDNAQLLVIDNVGPNGGNLVILQPGGLTIAAGPLGVAPSPLPSPAASPASTAVPQSAAIPNLNPATAYSVLFYAAPATNCTDPQASGTIGSFVTQ